MRKLKNRQYIKTKTVSKKITTIFNCITQMISQVLRAYVFRSHFSFSQLHFLGSDVDVTGREYSFSKSPSYVRRLTLQHLW